MGFYVRYPVEVAIQTQALNPKPFITRPLSLFEVCTQLLLLLKLMGMYILSSLRTKAQKFKLA